MMILERETDTNLKPVYPQVRHPIEWQRIGDDADLKPITIFFY